MFNTFLLRMSAKTCSSSIIKTLKILDLLKISFIKARMEPFQLPKIKYFLNKFTKLEAATGMCCLITAVRKI